MTRERSLQNLEAIRKEKGIKQATLAEMLGVHQNTYSGYLTKTGDLKISRLSQICDKLNIKMIDVITYPEKYVPESNECTKCKEKEDIIRHLSNYIDLLERRLKAK